MSSLSGIRPYLTTLLNLSLPPHLVCGGASSILIDFPLFRNLTPRIYKRDDFLLPVLSTRPSPPSQIQVFSFINREEGDLLLHPFGKNAHKLFFRIEFLLPALLLEEKISFLSIPPTFFWKS